MFYADTKGADMKKTFRLLNTKKIISFIMATNLLACLGFSYASGEGLSANTYDETFENIGAVSLWSSIFTDFDGGSIIEGEIQGNNTRPVCKFRISEFF